MKNALNEDQNLLENFIQNFTEAFIIIDTPTNQVSYVNPLFEKIWGMQLPEFEHNALALLDKVYPDDKTEFINSHKNIITEKWKGTAEFRIGVPGGVQKWVCVKAETFQGKEGQTEKIVALVEDITKRKIFERSLINLNEQKETVLHILAHDLSAPFAIIRTLAKVLEKDFDRQAFQEIKKYAQLIQESSDNSLLLITDLMEMINLESENTAINQERVDLVQKISKIVETYKRANTNTGLTFDFDCDCEVLYASIDEVKFMLILSNLISNAVKFTQRGGIVVSLKEKGDRVMLQIRDTGIGIPEKHHAILFDIFTKAQRKGLHGEKGTGLGMSIVKKVIDLHKGDIRFESQEGKGTCFFIALPKK